MGPFLRVSPGCSLIEGLHFQMRLTGEKCISTLPQVLGRIYLLGTKRWRFLFSFWLPAKDCSQSLDTTHIPCDHLKTLQFLQSQTQSLPPSHLLRWSLTLCNLVKGVTPHHLCCILLIRSHRFHIQGGGTAPGHESLGPPRVYLPHWWVSIESGS